MTYKLRNQGSDATDSWTSTAWKCSWIIGKHRCTSASKTRWSRRVPCIDGLLCRRKYERIECLYRSEDNGTGELTRSSLVRDDRRALRGARKLVLQTCNCYISLWVWVMYGANTRYRVHEYSRCKYIHSLKKKRDSQRKFQIHNPQPTHTYLTIPQLGIPKRISLQNPPKRTNPLFTLIPRIFR